MSCWRQRPRQDHPGGRHPLHRAPRPGLERGVRQGNVLVAARIPTMPQDVGVAVVAYLRDGRPTSSCRRLFLRKVAPNVGFASGCAITMIATTALERAGIRDY